ncbi:hypothetical protein F3N42_00390 [Marinihelvus fidelis]|uniref:Inosine/uridine-preferring nucleoside hydrolase domain-containing protein n=1 Tax=Marinihelvus fidelis TaxID=2613842 RepID=A0A5N0THW0_9GAMM|nr:nucleoside hydrolase [Marinihelvus fidelis]KAA9134044.1 hypothetical protein F3N42_00390 [Marinihelvus fidelis]
MKTFILVLLLMWSGATALAAPKIIFDTDFGGDADDLGALAMLHNLQKAGHCELLAIGNWNTERYAQSAIVATNRFYGQGDIPVGLRPGDGWAADWQYSRPVAEALPELAPDPTEAAPSVVDVYRATLAAQAPGTVQFVTVGPLANILALLESGPDEHSDMGGRELVASRVQRFVIMGGQYPQGDNEWNFDGDQPGVTRRTLEMIDVPVVFSGYELGEPIRTGPALAKLPEKHPLRVGYRYFSQHAFWMKDRFTGQILDNASYDQTAVLFAVLGGEGEWWSLSQPGTVLADDEGGNRWQPDPQGRHRYLVAETAPDNIAAVIREWMMK